MGARFGLPQACRPARKVSQPHIRCVLTSPPLTKRQPARHGPPLPLTPRCPPRPPTPPVTPRSVCQSVCPRLRSPLPPLLQILPLLCRDAYGGRCLVLLVSLSVCRRGSRRLIMAAAVLLWRLVRDFSLVFLFLSKSCDAHTHARTDKRTDRRMDRPAPRVLPPPPQPPPPPGCVGRAAAAAAATTHAHCLNTDSWHFPPPPALP